MPYKDPKQRTEQARRRRAAGLCVNCGSKVNGPGVRCERCRSQYNERRRKAKPAS